MKQNDVPKDQLKKKEECLNSEHDSNGGSYHSMKKQCEEGKKNGHGYNIAISSAEK